MSGEPRTCFELYKRVVKLATESDGGLTSNNIKLIKEFAMAACQVGTGGANKDSMLVLKVGLAHSNTEEIAWWCHQRLEYILGPVARV